MDPRRRLAALPAAVATGTVVALVVLAGCSSTSPPEERRTEPGSVALRVETVAGADELDDDTRAEVEGAVGEVLSTYVLEAFLGDFPRQEFVPSFESFTSGAARSAAVEIDRLTAARVRDATDVRATDLDARLSFLTRSGTVHGGTAAVHFAFEATLQDGSTRPLVLDGRFMLDSERGTWSIFGYDVALDDGTGVDVGTSS